MQLLRVPPPFAFCSACRLRDAQVGPVPASPQRTPPLGSGVLQGYDEGGDSEPAFSR